MNDIVYIPKRLVFLAATVVVLFIGAVVSLYAVRQPSPTQTETHAQTISQNGAPVCTNQKPQDIVLLFDVSSSMTDLTANGTTRLVEAKKAAKNFVNIIASKNTGTNYRISVVRFADFSWNGSRPSGYPGPMYTQILTDLSTNFTSINQTIDSLYPPDVNKYGGDYGFTCTECGLHQANREFTVRSNATRDKTIILLTDGGANWRENTTNWDLSLDPPVGDLDDFNANGQTYNWSRNAAYTQDSIAKKAGIKIDVIGIGDHDDNYGVQYYPFTQKIASDTGGLYYSSPNGSDLFNIYNNLAGTFTTPATGVISGIVFNDLNHNNTFDPPAETGIDGWPVTLYDENNNPIATDTTKNGGKYSFTGLCAGKYKVVERVSNGWINVTPNPIWVTLSNGSTQTANFGNYLSSAAWIQDEAFDMRIDQGFTDSFPPTINTQWWQGPYASVSNLSYSKTPGVILGGSNADFINGYASKNPYNWQVGTLRFSEKYSNSRPLSLSYAQAYSKAFQELKQAPQDLPCNPQNCILATVAPGVYNTNGDLTITDPNGTFIPSGSYTLLVKGNVEIKKSIQVQKGAFFMVIASGSITVDSSVGVPAPGSTTTSQLQGLYVADNDFTVNDNGRTCNDGGISDLVLDVSGAIVVNANRQGGNFVQQRKLCGVDAYNPVFRITPRLDMLMNFPSFLLTPTRNWQEVAP